MIEPALFWKSRGLGLAVAAPLGPIGAHCISRSLERGFWAGVAGGLGTALADAIYASLAAAIVLFLAGGPFKFIKLYETVFATWFIR